MKHVVKMIMFLKPYPVSCFVSFYLGVPSASRRIFNIVSTLIAFSLAGAALGQIELELKVVPSRALLYEPISAEIVVYNHTGATMNFDASGGATRFFFEIERYKNETVRQMDRSPLFFGRKIVSGGSLSNAFNLTSLYAMNNLGSYKINACIEWNNTLFISAPVEINILKGFEMARVISGVPGGEGAMRVYILEYLPKDDGEYVYLRIEDEINKKIYGANNLGRIVRVRKPELKTDEAGNIHVLFQSVSMMFIHTAFTPSGVQLFYKSYMDKSNAVHLQSLPNGKISVLAPVSGATSAGEAQLQEVQQSSSNQPAKAARLGRGGLMGPK